VVGLPLPGLLATGSNGHPKRLSSYDHTWFEILLRILIFHIFIHNIFWFSKIIKKSDLEMGKSILPENIFYKIFRETLFFTKNKTIERETFGN